MKIFVTSKIYDTDTKPITDIEKEIQNDLDNYVGANKVIFNLSIKRKTATMTFYRGVDYSGIDTNNEMIDPDAYMITGLGFNDFTMPSPLPPMRFPGYFRSIITQSDFLKAYKKSAVMLGGNKIKVAKLDINGSKIVLTLEMK